MLTNSKSRLVACGLAAALFVPGCSGDDPAPTPSATATAAPTPQATATQAPKAAKTPDPHFSPLGGKPATEEEKEYYRLQKKAEDLVFAKNYKDAIPLLEQAYEQQPKDYENAFHLMISHGSLEGVASKASAAYPYAKKVLELAPNTNEASRAREYLIAAEFSPPEDFKYGKKTLASYGGFVYDGETAYKLTSDTPLHVDIQARITKDGKANLWEAEVAPEMVSGNRVTLEKGTEIKVLSEIRFFHGLTSWRKPLPQKPGESDFDDSYFEVDAMYVEVVSDGDNKGKKGWMVTQIDRFMKPGETDPWATWIPSRVDMLRAAEVVEKK